MDWAVGGIVAIVAIQRGILDTDKDEEEQNGHSHAGS